MLIYCVFQYQPYGRHVLYHSVSCILPPSVGQVLIYCALLHKLYHLVQALFFSCVLYCIKIMRELVFGGIWFAWLFNLLKFYIGSCRIYERLLYKVELDEEYTLRIFFFLLYLFLYIM